jgi:hypothetical protein
MTMSDLVVKSFRGFEIKDADKGEVEAKVATLEVVDKDGDIIRAGAQGKTATVAMSDWAHNAVFGKRPVGKGKLVEDGGQLKFAGRAFLKTFEGRETFETLKEMGEDQEWSFAFRVLAWENPSEAERKAGASRVITKMGAFEVSPVLVGAGVGTGTTGLKSAQSPAPEPPVPPAPVVDDALVKAVASEVMARMAAEQKAVAEAAAEAERVEAETKAAAEAAALAEAKAVEAAAAAREFETFQRTMRKIA